MCANKSAYRCVLAVAEGCNANWYAQLSQQMIT